jgi:redox-sensitive bicupin YhaK (pirin superfamily)
MFTKIPSEQIYLGRYGWHTDRFHFSFADYADPNNINFGDLLAFNDFVLQPNSGFAPHAHRELEIISYCVQGELFHEDNLGNMTALRRGDAQYTCAGTGIVHSEINHSPDKPLRFIQVWIKPNADGLAPVYGTACFEQTDRLDRLLQIASGQPARSVFRINQDANLFVSELRAGKELRIEQLPGRQSYLTCLEGSLFINGSLLKDGDAVKMVGESTLTLSAVTDCHLLIIEMPTSL